MTHVAAFVALRVHTVQLRAPHDPLRTGRPGSRLAGEQHLGAKPRIRAECALAARAEDIRLYIAQADDPIACRHAAGPARWATAEPGGARNAVAWRRPVVDERKTAPSPLIASRAAAAAYLPGGRSSTCE